MFISFIITYHDEPLPLLSECVRHVLQLPLKAEEREVIVVDDGSQSSAEDEMRQLSADIRYERQSCQGLSVARNTGLRIACGRYIQFIDADDYLLVDGYAEVLKLLLAQRPQLLMFRATSDPLREKLDSHPAAMSGTDFLLRHNMRAAAWGYVFERSLLDDLRFQPNLLHEDELFTPQLLLRTDRLLLTSTTPYFYRQHSGTITHNTDQQHIQHRLDDMRFILQLLLGLLPQLSPGKQTALQRRIHQLTQDYLYNCYRLAGFAELRKRAAALKREHLLPLPLKNYSIRYLVMAVLLNIV